MDRDHGSNIYILVPTPLKNVHLLKDIIVLPYVYYKHFGKSITVVTKITEEYPYIRYVDELQIQELRYEQDSEYEDAQIRFLEKNYQRMDMICLFGPYGPYFRMTELYKKLRPDGKVYLKLDMNVFWADRMMHNWPSYEKFFSFCDVISCEALKLQRYLCKKWPFRIEYIPNGYWNFFSEMRETVSYGDKENIILTVGYLGSYQKNNELLLNAFEKVADQLPDWNVRLVGPVKPQFTEWLEQWFLEHPDLHDRIYLCGEIQDKEELYKEYRRAKIFALTSRFEGGCPNVYSEAAIHGCCMVATEIDASEDITGFGRFGEIAPVDDETGFARALIRMCKDEDRMRRESAEIQQYIWDCFDYDKLAQRLELLLKLSRGSREYDKAYYDRDRFCAG